MDYGGFEVPLIGGACGLIGAGLLSSEKWDYVPIQEIRFGRLPLRKNGHIVSLAIAF